MSKAKRKYQDRVFRKLMYVERFKLKPEKYGNLPTIFRGNSEALLNQLDRCPSDLARRLILGVKA